MAIVGLVEGSIVLVAELAAAGQNQKSGLRQFAEGVHETAVTVIIQMGPRQLMNMMVVSATIVAGSNAP